MITHLKTWWQARKHRQRWEAMQGGLLGTLDATPYRWTEADRAAVETFLISPTGKKLRAWMVAQDYRLMLRATETQSGETRDFFCGYAKGARGVMSEIIARSGIPAEAENNPYADEEDTGDDSDREDYGL